MTTTLTSSGGSQKIVMPCAACKLLRRRCAIECPFAPYFHPSEPQRFAVVHKVFGASNVAKMLLDVPEKHRVDVANSLVYEANARLRDPVYGCLGIISSLQQHAQALQAELHEVRSQIMRLRFQESAMAAAASANNHIVNTQNLGANLSNNDNNANIINDVSLNRSTTSNRTDNDNIGMVTTTTHLIPSHSLTDSTQLGTSSTHLPCTGKSTESIIEQPNIDHSKEHYWSKLHQSCR